MQNHKYSFIFNIIQEFIQGFIFRKGLVNLEGCIIQSVMLFHGGLLSRGSFCTEERPGFQRISSYESSNENDENSKRMMEWLDEFNMSANIDLHTAPGSQNGFDNSGRTGQVGRSKLHIRLIAETMKDWLNKIYFKRKQFTHSVL